MNNKSTQTKRGRDEYNKFAIQIKVLRQAVALLPNRLKIAALNFNRNSDNKISRLIRFCGLSAIAISCGDLVDIRNQVDLLGVNNTSFGSRVSIHPKCYIDGTGGLSIGNDVSIAHHTTILSTTHVWKDRDIPIRDQTIENRPTQIHDNVWIGAGCRIMAGVKIYPRSIVAAGAVVTKDVPAGSIVAGIPAKIIKQI